MIALARLLGGVDLPLLGIGQQSIFGCFSFFAADSITNRLSLSGFPAVFRRSVLQVGPSDPPSPSGVPTILTAIAIQVMIRRERTIAPLEKANSGGESGRFALRSACRERILSLGQGGA